MRLLIVMVVLCAACGSVVEPPRCMRWTHVTVPDDSGRGSVVLSVCAEYSKT